MRVLGSCVQTIGTKPADNQILQQAAKRLVETLADKEYLARCREDGLNHYGPVGATMRIANLLLTYLGESPRQNENSL
jgi:hypothetical protein